MKKKILGNFRGRLYGFVFIFLVSVIFFGILAGELFGRAGGGDGYPEGGSDGGGGGDGIIFEIVFRILWYLIWHHPIIGIPLTLVVIGIAIYVGVEGKERYVAGKIRTGMQAQDKVQKSNALSLIKKRDPGFQENAFLERSKKGFLMIQKAWSEQNLNPVQGFISDGVFERFSLQIQEQKALGYKDIMENTRILQCSIGQVQSDEHFDTISAYIKASATNYRMNGKTGKKIGGAAEDTFEEYWSFVRKPGAKTLGKPGLIEGFCPNCGAPVEIGQTAKCNMCNSHLRSGEYDWVLSEITQACEWSVGESSRIPGYMEIKKADPGFSLQHIEDRGSVIFWRMVTADRLGNIAPLMKVALETCCSEVQKSIAPNAEGVRTYMGDCAVGSVETKAIQLNEDFDRIFVEIRWSGGKKSVSSKGELKAIGGVSARLQIFVFVRKHGVKTDVRSALISSHCPNCGAPESNVEAAACEYCRTVLNDGSFDWVLEKITSPHDPEYWRTIKVKTSDTPAGNQPGIGGPVIGSLSGDPFSSAPSGMEGVSWMVYMMLADGKIDEKEMALLRDFSKKRNISQEKLDGLIHAVSSKSIDFPLPESREEKMGLMKALTGMALADGRITSEEQEALNTIGKRMGFGVYDLKILAKQEQKRFFELAKKAIIEEKKLSQRS